MRKPDRYLSCGSLVAGLVLLGGCSNGGGLDLGSLTGGGDNQVRYRCDDDRTLRVRFSDDRDRATVEAGDSTYRLRLTDRDGSRRTYGDDDVRLIVDGDEARLRVSGGRDYSGCEET